MSWVCKICSSNNDDSAEFCFVCDSPKAVAPPPPAPAATSHPREAHTYSLTKKRAADLHLSGDIVVPAEFTAIADGAFYNRTDVRSVTLHAGVTKIGKQAFKGCTNLKRVVCPARLTSIASEAFKDCPIPVSGRPSASYVASDAFSEPTSGMYDGWDHVAPISEFFRESTSRTTTSGSARTTPSTPTRTASTSSTPRTTSSTTSRPTTSASSYSSTSRPSTSSASSSRPATSASSSSRPTYSYTPSRRSRRSFDKKTVAKILFWSAMSINIIVAAVIWLTTLL